jgi:hypothetical protein
MGINAHRAFFSATNDDNYIGALTVEESERVSLRAVRDEIRETIKQGFRDWSEFLDRRELFEAAALATTYLYDDDPTLRPKFRMQGSWSYATLNRTTTEPPQEIDLDDGLFLPVSFLGQNGAAHPAIVSEAYFAAVEKMLAPLCEKRGWTLVTGKPSCVRVAVREGAHVDLALYAIPDKEFEVLVEKVETASARFASRIDESLISFAEDIYPQIPTDHIMLAHRTEGWKPSDPRKLEDWFQDAVDRHGAQLRRVCRYLKGWRDHHWDTCRLSSITLMACVVVAFDEASAKPAEDRDDKALLMVAERLPELLGGRIANPVVDGQYLDENWTTESRSDFVAEAQKLATNLLAALVSSKPSEAAAILGLALGDYIPDSIDAYVSEGPDGAPAILTTGLLKDFADEPEAQSAVKFGGDSRYG